MLIVLLLGIADFGRVFTAGIVMEAASRNAAEAVAQEYLQLRRSTTPPTATDYDRLRDVALATVCEEAERLPDREMSGSTCLLPVAGVCIHDFASELGPDYVGRCGAGSSGAPVECSDLSSWAATEPATGTLPYVEVRLCYRFKTLWNLEELQLPLANGLSLGHVWLQRSNTFVVADY